MENNAREVGIGWPLGLGSMHMRLRQVDSLPIGVAEEPSSTFSSFSSSNLDTELGSILSCNSTIQSTKSFFQDTSKTLGRLMGIRPRNRRSELYLRNSIDRFEERKRLCSRDLSEHQNQSGNEDGLDMRRCDGFCVPVCLVVKTNNTKVSSKS